MNWKEIAKDYFTFTRRERIATLTLLTLILITVFAPSVFKSSKSLQISYLDSGWSRLATDSNRDENGESQHETMSYQFDGPSRFSGETATLRPFNFDPNTLNEDGWKQLGLRPRTIQTIIKYRSKGGRFKKPEDLARVYGLRKEEFDLLLPYIRMEKQMPSGSPNAYAFASQPRSLMQKEPEIIDINTADTSALIALPGIGSKLAARIINFREKLGGFYCSDQLSEIYGLPDSTFQKIKALLQVKDRSIKTIDLNSVTIEELRTHPYMKGNIASTIVAYRNEHGPYSAVEDVKKVMTITDDIYKKIHPYLTAE